MKLHPVELERLTPEILHVFGRQPPLLTAGDKTGLNTMTIGWCQLGRLWNLPVCTVYVRPERYTYQFMESHDYFTVSILPEEAKKVTALCGSKSGPAGAEWHRSDTAGWNRQGERGGNPGKSGKTGK